MANDPMAAAQVFELGRAAAQASQDAHGSLVAPTMAYDFITNMASEEPMDLPAWEMLPMEMKIGFLEGYYHDAEAGNV
jgi:hypothetical protein